MNTIFTRETTEFPLGEGRLLSIKEAAAEIRMDISTLRRRIFAGKGPLAFRPPGSNRLRIYENWLRDWATSGGIVQGRYRKQQSAEHSLSPQASA
jgi:hypothetical protein